MTKQPTEHELAAKRALAELAKRERLTVAQRKQVLAVMLDLAAAEKLEGASQQLLVLAARADTARELRQCRRSLGLDARLRYATRKTPKNLLLVPESQMEFPTLTESQWRKRFQDVWLASHGPLGWEVGGDRYPQALEDIGWTNYWRVSQLPDDLPGEFS